MTLRRIYGKIIVNKYLLEENTTADKAISITKGILALYDIPENVNPYISAATTDTSKKRGRRKKAQLRNEYKGIPLDKFNTTFMQYDNMEKWMKDNDYLC